MKVFISWSGEKSRAVGGLLQTWLECVLQSVKPWMSEDIERGALWFGEIAEQLREATIGLICLTQDNRQAPWIMFEAGALAKGLEKSRICTLLIDLEPADVGGPLAQFNHTRPDKKGLLQLVQTLNRGLGDNGLRDHVLTSVFETYWPKFAESFQEILQGHSIAEKEVRANDDKLDELILAVRGLSQRVSRMDTPAARSLSRTDDASIDHERAIDMLIENAKSRAHIDESKEQEIRMRLREAQREYLSNDALGRRAG